tara:strand:- start:153 stop:500 length:348 start_codon:yes stop_codon:yes gene_type:complete
MKMFYKSFICITLFAYSLSFNLFSQENANLNDSINYEELSAKLEGTYQIEMIDTRSLPSFPAELLLIIEDKRDDNNIIYHRVSDVMRVKILPRSIINAKDFKPVERINYISSKDF